MDIKHIEALIEVIKGSHVSELAVKSDDSAVIVRKSAGGNSFAVVAPPQTVPVDTKLTVPTEAPQVEIPVGPVISAPMVGIFHVIDGIKGPGVQIKKGQVVGIIESMKLMNEIVSQVDGTVEEILVDDGMPVEYGHALFRLKEV
jgi:acetyl-CoA carboxylase biotin carboxyl carrier protein